MDRNELIEVGAGMLRTMPADLPPMDRTTHARFIAASVINAVEPLIRADERERLQHVDFYAASVARRVVLADLRDKVEALGMYSTFGPDGSLDGSDVVLRSDVLDLIDGGDHHGNA